MELSLVITPEVLAKGISYEYYRQLIDEKLSQGQTTGNNHSEAMLEYTKMNVQRMNRWDKTMKVSSELQQKAEALTQKLYWVVLTEAWCGDAAQSIPFLAKVASLSPMIEFKLLLRDENLSVMDAYPTNGARSIPKLIAFNEDLSEELFQWGPRPAELQDMVMAYKEDPKSVSQEEFVQGVHLWYAKNKNRNLDAELLALLSAS